MMSLISWSSRIPAAFEQGPALAAPENWQTPFGMLQEGSDNVKLRPYLRIEVSVIS
jgi:hypothetical protein